MKPERQGTVLCLMTKHDNRQGTVFCVLWKDLLTNYNGRTITYDGIGNPENYRNGHFTWSGRELSIVSTDSGIMSYAYGEDSLRTQKTVYGTVTDYYWLNGVLLGQKKGDEHILFLYDENGSVYGMLLKNGTTEEYYYYIFNAQGDVIGIVDSAGIQVVEYTYSPWGEILSVTGTKADTIGQKNPLRYRGYYYDNETGFYYLQSRYYDPETGRFISADGYVSTGHGILGYNMFAYCENNPISFSDPSGAWKQVNGGWQAQSGDTLWGLSVLLYGNGTMWTTFGFGRDPKTLQVGEVINVGSNSSTSINNGLSTQIRDVTSEVSVALAPYIAFGKSFASLSNRSPIFIPYCYGIFASLVNHRSTWDIKVPISWESTIGTPFPGHDAFVLYGGMLMTPENLGNYTYGLLGAAFGISYPALVCGSVFAAFTGGSMKRASGIRNEIGDWNYIAMGYSKYYF